MPTWLRLWLSLLNFEIKFTTIIQFLLLKFRKKFLKMSKLFLKKETLFFLEIVSLKTINDNF